MDVIEHDRNSSGTPVKMLTLDYNTYQMLLIYRGGSRGGAHPARAPPKIGKYDFFA